MIKSTKKKDILKAAFGIVGLRLKPNPKESWRTNFYATHNRCKSKPLRSKSMGQSAK